MPHKLFVSQSNQAIGRQGAIAHAIGKPGVKRVKGEDRVLCLTPLSLRW
ncbi:hypothetical protein [Dendronalium sp. ChiSLP03b]|nr:hypothetical protein [Dendronalium sp. ChiSLP03b]MDZ8205542.1 hypothetical protein [Dendronalium sp. ChiSLP03b]